MRKSARLLGKEYWLTAQEMNFLLKEEGFLDGEPNNYFATEKGEPYAHLAYDHNNKWTTISWDDSILDELNITEDRKNELRQTIQIEKQKRKNELKRVASEDEDIVIESNDYCGDEEDSTISGVAIIGGVLLVLCLIAGPQIKHFWGKLKAKIIGSPEGNT